MICEELQEKDVSIYLITDISRWFQVNNLTQIKAATMKTATVFIEHKLFSHSVQSNFYV